MTYLALLVAIVIGVPLVARIASLFVPLTFSYEDRHDKESWLQWQLGNWLVVPVEWVRSVGIVWGFKENDKWCLKPRVTGEDSLYFNGILFLRLSLPLDARFGLRWSGSTTKAALFQTGAGFKLNGRFAPTFRVQSDESAAAGTNSPNYFSGRGWEYGSH